MFIKQNIFIFIQICVKIEAKIIFTYFLYYVRKIQLFKCGEKKKTIENNVQLQP